MDLLQRIQELAVEIKNSSGPAVRRTRKVRLSFYHKWLDLQLDAIQAATFMSPAETMQVFTVLKGLQYMNRTQHEISFVQEEVHIYGQDSEEDHEVDEPDLRPVN